MNRPGGSTLLTRRWKRLCGKYSWFQPGNKEQGRKSDARKTGKRKRQEEDAKVSSPVEGVLFIQYTPGSILKKEIMEANKVWDTTTAGKIRVKERLPSSIKETLTNPHPWKKDPCGRTSCPSCARNPGHCKKANVNYRIDCLDCKEVCLQATYWGETHRSHYARMLEQVDNLRRMKEESPLYRHWREHHGGQGEPPTLEYKVTSSHMTSTERQVAGGPQYSEGQVRAKYEQQS